MPIFCKSHSAVRKVSMNLSFLDKFANLEMALARAKNGKFGQSEVKAIENLPSQFQPGTENFYNFKFEALHPGTTTLLIQPRFTSQFAFQTTTTSKDKSITTIILSSRTPPYLNTRHDKCPSSEKCLFVAQKYLVWRACLYLDVFITPYVDEHFSDIIPQIRLYVRGDIWVPDAF